MAMVFWRANKEKVRVKLFIFQRYFARRGIKPRLATKGVPSFGILDILFPGQARVYKIIK
jgi:hypothetical protein